MSYGLDRMHLYIYSRKWAYNFTFFHLNILIASVHFFERPISTVSAENRYACNIFPWTQIIFTSHILLWYEFWSMKIIMISAVGINALGHYYNVFHCYINLHARVHPSHIDLCSFWRVKWKYLDNSVTDRFVYTQIGTTHKFIKNNSWEKASHLLFSFPFEQTTFHTQSKYHISHTLVSASPLGAWSFSFH